MPDIWFEEYHELPDIDEETFDPEEVDSDLCSAIAPTQEQINNARRRMEQILEERRRFGTELRTGGGRIEGTFRAVEPEGEDVPEVPEMPDITPANTLEEVSDEVITPEVIPDPPLVVPEIRGVYFNTRGGSQMRAGTQFRNNDASETTVQVSFWDMQPNAVRTAYAALIAWMEEKGYGYSSASPDYFTDGTLQVNILYYFAIVKSDHRNYNSFAEMLSQPDCECGEAIAYPSTQCPACEAMLYCTSCRAFYTDVHSDSEYGTYCSRCAVACNNNDCEAGIFHANQRTCPTCNPRIRCRGCSEHIYTNGDQIHVFTNSEGREFNYCDDCYSGLCRTCGAIVGIDMILEDEGHNCTSCVSMNSNEEWDADSVLTAEEIVIPTIPGREVIRMVGLEIEGANGPDYVGHEGGNMLSHNLYSEGLTRNPEMSGYHSSDGRRMTVHVERDSSVDWELVIGPMNVADEGQVEIMNRSVRVVRNMINDNTLKLDMRAGMHVHVGADKVPFHNAYNLHKLYMYMEDFLYRFGAAKWPYHRSITRRGRDASGKSPSTEGKLNFARTFSGQRYYGLSFDNYFNRYFEGCNCGARQYGLFDECECDLGKCTFEFRLFNTTANTKKIHAYLAMSQALVAKAIELDEITNAREYPALDFVTSRVSDMNGNTRNKYVREWEKRIVFVNEQLPLTQEEKKSIHYCVINSEMGKVVSNADILLETEEN